jgi:hypothetical protein
MATGMKEWMAANRIQLLEHPLYSSGLAPANVYLFRRVKEALGGIKLDQESFKNIWKGVTINVAAGDFATAFGRKYLDRR